MSRIGHVDLETGEVMEHATMALILRRGRNGFGKRWFAMAQDPLAELARNGERLGFQATRVLLLMMSAMKFENEVVLSNGQAAKELGMSPSNVSRATRKLVDMKLLEEGPKLGALRSYRMNPNFAWKGKGVDHGRALVAKPHSGEE